MASLFSLFLTALTCILAVPVFVFFVEIVASLFWRAEESFTKVAPRRPIAILIPAHNEGAGIGLTLQNIKSKLFDGDRLLVVADNCTDDTAQIAALAGAEVIVRDDPERVGKGYALDFGITHLDLNPPEIVIFFDADCVAAERAIDLLVQACTETTRPVQALYLMRAPDGFPMNNQVSEFAWRVKNWLRPLGLRMLGLPCQLTGIGMAFPWQVIRKANLAHGSIVEDMKLGLSFAQAGSAPLFCPAAIVTSTFASTAGGQHTQRKRWEHGHIGMIWTEAPRYLWSALQHGNLGLLALVFDLTVPPLSLLVLLLAGMLLVSGVANLFGGGELWLSRSTQFLFLFWSQCPARLAQIGRDLLSIGGLLSVAGYAIAKLPLYCRMLLDQKTSQWVRTDRRKSKSASPHQRPSRQRANRR